MDLPEALQEIEKRGHEVAVLSSENRLLRQELQSIRQGIFGSKTERLSPGQLALFGKQGELPASPEAAPREVKAKSKSKGHGRQPFAANLPREVHASDLPEEDRICSCCDEVMQKIKEQVTERGDLIPSRVRIKRYVASVYACPNGHEMRTAPVPEAVVPRAKYEASVYANLAVSKYGDHLPLNRLEGIFKRNGLHLPKQTMWDMLCTVDDLVAQPIIEQMRREVLESDVLHSDDTTIKVKVEDQKGSKQGHIWTWRTPRPLTPNDEPKEYRDAILHKSEWLDSTVISNGCKVGMHHWLASKIAEDYAMTSDHDTRWRVGGSVTEVKKDAQIDPASLEAGMRHFAKDRSKRLAALQV